MRNRAIRRRPDWRRSGWRSFRARQNNFDEADALYQRAIATEDPKSIDAGVTMSMYSSFLKKQGRLEEAATYLEQSKQVYMANSVGPRPVPEYTGLAVQFRRRGCCGKSSRTTPRKRGSRAFRGPW